MQTLPFKLKPLCFSILQWCKNTVSCHYMSYCWVSTCSLNSCNNFQQEKFRTDSEEMYWKWFLPHSRHCTWYKTPRVLLWIAHPSYFYPLSPSRSLLPMCTVLLHPWWIWAFLETYLFPWQGGCGAVPKQANTKVSHIHRWDRCLYLLRVGMEVRGDGRISPDSTTTQRKMEYQKTERTAHAGISPSF